MIHNLPLDLTKISWSGQLFSKLMGCFGSGNCGFAMWPFKTFLSVRSALTCFRWLEASLFKTLHCVLTGLLLQIRLYFLAPFARPEALGKASSLAE